MTMIFLYDKIKGAIQNARMSELPVRDLIGNWRHDARGVFDCRVTDLTPEQRAQLEAAGIGVDDPMDEMPEAFKERVKTFRCDPFFTTSRIATQTEYDFRKSGDVYFLCDRDGSGWNITSQSGDRFMEISRFRYSQFDTLINMIYTKPIAKIVLFHDFWNRLPISPPSSVTEDCPVLRTVPKVYPAPIDPTRTEPEPTIAPAAPTIAPAAPTIAPAAPTPAPAPAPVSDLLPLAIGSSARIELGNEVNTIHFWDSATYINKEQLKRWGARFHGLDKYWYFETVPTESIQHAVRAMRITMRVRFS